MTKTLLFSALLLYAGRAAAVQPATPLPDGGAWPALIACAMVTLAALSLAWMGLRYGAASEARAHALQLQLHCEREARTQADDALAASHDVMCSLVRRQAGSGDREPARNGVLRRTDSGAGGPGGRRLRSVAIRETADVA